MVEVRDFGLAKLKLELRKLSTLRVLSGWSGPKAEAQHENANVAVGTVAGWLMFGTENADGTEKMPARPALEEGMKQNKQDFERGFKRGVADLVDQRVTTAKGTLENVAKVVQKGMLKTFDAAREWAEPLADATVIAKGHDQPLVDSEQVRSALESKVAPNEGGPSIGTVVDR